MSKTSLIIKQLSFLIILPCLTYFFHEFAHWIAFRFYNIEAHLSLNTIRLINEIIELTSTQKFIIY